MKEARVKTFSVKNPLDVGSCKKVQKQDKVVSTQYRKTAEKKHKKSIPYICSTHLTVSGTHVGYTLFVFLLCCLFVLCAYNFILFLDYFTTPYKKGFSQKKFLL